MKTKLFLVTLLAVLPLLVGCTSTRTVYVPYVPVVKTAMQTQLQSITNDNQRQWAPESGQPTNWSQAPGTMPAYTSAPFPPQQQVVVQPRVIYGGYGYGDGAVRVSTGRFLGIPYTSTSWSYQTVMPPVYVPPMEIYYSYPSYSAGFEWRSGRLVRHRTWGPHPHRR